VDLNQSSCRCYWSRLELSRQLSKGARYSSSQKNGDRSIDAYTLKFVVNSVVSRHLGTDGGCYLVASRITCLPSDITSNFSAAWYKAAHSLGGISKAACGCNARQSKIKAYCRLTVPSQVGRARYVRPGLLKLPIAGLGVSKLSFRAN